MFVDAFNKLGISEEQICPFHGTLVGFVGEQVRVKGHVELLTTFAVVRSIPVKFLIMERVSPYKAILERPSLNKIGAIISTLHLAIKLPLPNNQVQSSMQIKKRHGSVMWIT